MDLLGQLKSWLLEPTTDQTHDIDEPRSFQDLSALEKKIKIVPAPEPETRYRPTIDQVQQLFIPYMREYLATPNPPYIMLVLASPGTGKTTAAVGFAEACIDEGLRKRILYAGPRRNFYQDVSSIAKTNNWYKWLPRQVSEDETETTCIHAENIAKWLGRGYEAIDFCRQVCGWDYYNHECEYMKQKRRHERIIYGNHQHLTMGHPLDFDMVIGDENPQEAFLNQWVIPESSIVPDKMQFSAYKELLMTLAGLARSATWTNGENLIRQLGGSDHVLDVVQKYLVEPDILSPNIYYTDDVDRVPYNHIFSTASMLAREARLAKFFVDYIPRIAIGNGSMTLFLKREVDWEQMPRHVIWLDATANPQIYAELFNRQVLVVDARPEIKGRIYQIHDRLNGKTSMTNTNGSSVKAKQAFRIVDSIIQERGYQNPSVITFDKIEEEMNGESIKTGHFYAARGTNDYEDSDAIFIVGTPQPPAPTIVAMASMIYFKRDRAFRTEWQTAGIPDMEDEDGMRDWLKNHIGQYNYIAEDGFGRAYPISGFWKDKDLQEVLWSQREAEIIQAAHRIRPVRQDADIWLLTNLPIWELPPTRLMTMTEALNAPQGVNIFRWAEILSIITQIESENGVVTSEDLMERCEIDQKTAKKYMNILIEGGDWKFVYAVRRQRGRPSLRIQRRDYDGDY